MRKFAITLTLFGVAALTAVGQQSTAINTSRSNVKNNIRVLPGPDGKPKCTSTAAGKTVPCGASEVASLNKALAGMIFTKTGASVKSVALAKDGSLMCTTISGTVPCNSTHLPDLKQADSRVNSELEQNQAAPASQK